MDIDLRTVILIGLLLLLAVVLWDGYRRMRQKRKHWEGGARSNQLAQPKQKKTHQGQNITEDTDWYNPELPSGKARVISSDQENLHSTADGEEQLNYGAFQEQSFSTASPGQTQEQSELTASHLDEANLQIQTEGSSLNATSDQQAQSLAGEAHQPERAAAANLSPPLKQQEAREQQTVQSPQLQQDKQLEPRLIIIHVLCKDPAGFSGQALFETVQQCNMHHGDMNIFHRYESATGRGGILFSMANAVEPGTFSTASDTAFATPGVTFFLSLPGPKSANQGFELMVATARRLAASLNGELRDAAHQPMTQQGIEILRHQTRDFHRQSQHAGQQPVL